MVGLGGPPGDRTRDTPIKKSLNLSLAAHFRNFRCAAAVELSTAIARDLAGLGPYDQALKRQGLTREAEYEHQGTEPPNPYDLALARRGDRR